VPVPAVVIKPYESVELGQARVFDLASMWRVWSTDPPHVRMERGDPLYTTIKVDNDTLFFVVGAMNDDGFFKILFENGAVVSAPVDQILTNSRLV